jgi:cysteine-rich CWC protein
VSRVPPATPPEPAPTSDTVLCPRCSAGFECGIQTGDCWCAGVMLDDVIRADMARFYDGCLCPTCLRTIEDARPATPNVWKFLRRNLKRQR